MKVCLVFDGILKRLQGGILTSYNNQRKALKVNSVKFTTDPNENFDILHIHLTPFTPYFLFRYRKKVKKIVIQCHTTHLDLKNTFILVDLIEVLLPYFIVWMCNDADIVLCPSGYAKTVLEAYGVKKRIIAISNGVDIKRFKPLKKVKMQLPKKQTIFSIGMASFRKGIVDFIKIAKHFPECCFIWFGEFPNKFMLSKQFEIRKALANIPKNAIFAGRVDNILDAYRAGDIFIFPSYGENEGIPILEAAAVGKPVIVRDLPVYDGWLFHERNCLKASNNEEFVNCINMLLEDKKLRLKLVRNGRQLAEKHSLKNVGRELKRIYEDLLNQ